MASSWTHKYVAIYDNDILKGLVLYKENGDCEINNNIDVYAEKLYIEELIKNIKESALPFEPISMSYFIENLEKTYALVLKKPIITHGEFITNIENFTVAKKQVIKQENKALKRKRVKIYDYT